MATQDLIIFEPTTSQEADVLKAFAKALKIKFEIAKRKEENTEIIQDLNEAVFELNLVKKGKTKARNARELIDEL